MSPESTTPTIVLVHGAFAESAGWADVIAELREQGYSAIAVANPLRGLEADAAYLRSIIDGIDGPVVVVGHSYGGAVMSIAADGADRVKALVYIASFNLEVGESAGELAAKFPGGELGTVLDPKPFPLAGGGWGTDRYLQRGKFHGAFAAERAGSTTVEVDASLAVYVSQPRAVADLIVDAARATTGAGLATAAV